MIKIPARHWTFAAALAMVVPAASGDEAAEATRIQARFDDLRPSERDLAMYRLDWEPSLDEAFARARVETRPVFAVVIHAKYGDIFSGHC